MEANEKNGVGEFLNLTIEGKLYPWSKQYITGAEIRSLAEISPELEIFLAIIDPWEDEHITMVEKVDLARPGIESFYVRKRLRITINGLPFEWLDQYITGKQLRTLGNIPYDHGIWLDIMDPFKDEIITDESKIDLARPGVEHFITKEKPFDVVIIVNAALKEWKEKTISFEQLVMLEFGSISGPDTGYTITYSRGVEPKPEGTMVKGSVVKVKNKMIFDVTATDKS